MPQTSTSQEPSWRYADPVQRVSKKKLKILIFGVAKGRDARGEMRGMQALTYALLCTPAHTHNTCLTMATTKQRRCPCHRSGICRPSVSIRTYLQRTQAVLASVNNNLEPTSTEAASSTASAKAPAPSSAATAEHGGASAEQSAATNTGGDEELAREMKKLDVNACEELRLQLVMMCLRFERMQLDKMVCWCTTVRIARKCAARAHALMKTLCWLPEHRPRPQPQLRIIKKKNYAGMLYC